jgi:hypothetical protein
VFRVMDDAVRDSQPLIEQFVVAEGMEARLRTLDRACKLATSVRSVVTSKMSEPLTGSQYT